MDDIREFGEQIKKNGNVKRLHIIGGEPLIHPQIDEIVDYFREEIWLEYVPEINIVSNMHKNLNDKYDTYDTMMDFLPFDKFLKIYDFESVETVSNSGFVAYDKAMGRAVSGKTLMVNLIHMYETLVNKGYPEAHKYVKELIQMNTGNFFIQGDIESTRDEKYDIYDLYKANFQNFDGDGEFVTKTYRGLPVVNYKPLSKKALEHRVTLVAPFDTGQEMDKTCDFPRHCGVLKNKYGYAPCGAAPAIIELFGLEDKYLKKELPKSETEWDGIDENGIVDLSPESGMYDLCKLCQVGAKKVMLEKDYGRPISVSFRKAMGMKT